MLNEFRDDFFVSEHVWHPEVPHFHEQSTGEIGRPCHFVNEHECHPKISRLQSRAARRNNSDKRPLHDFRCLADFDLEEMSILLTEHRFHFARKFS